MESKLAIRVGDACAIHKAYGSYMYYESAEQNYDFELASQAKSRYFREVKKAGFNIEQGSTLIDRISSKIEMLLKLPEEHTTLI